jgi:hypothetical protein
MECSSIIYSVLEYKFCEPKGLIFGIGMSHSPTGPVAGPFSLLKGFQLQPENKLAVNMHANKIAINFFIGLIPPFRIFPRTAHLYFANNHINYVSTAAQKYAAMLIFIFYKSIVYGFR